MSQAQIEQFSSRVKNDPTMFKQLVEGTQTPDEFIDKAVALGAENGFTFSREEADGWIKAQIESKANGELSDLQLEGVAGGKSANPLIAFEESMHAAGEWMTKTMKPLSNAIDGAKNSFDTWFQSW